MRSKKLYGSTGIATAAIAALIAFTGPLAWTTASSSVQSAAPIVLNAEPSTERALPDGGDQLLLSLSRPGEPGILIIQHHKGEVNITGYEGEVVVVSAVLRYADSTWTGMRPVRGNALRLHAIEKNNVVTVSTNSHERTIDLDIQVPRSFSLHIEKLDEGDVRAYYLSGEMEITSTSGGVQLLDVTGSAVISTVDGDMLVRLADVTPYVPMAFTSVSGDINVALPASISASVKMRTDHGDIMSDFNIEIARRRAEARTSATTGIQRAFLERWTYGTVGGGGPQILLQSYNGNITLQKIP